jgi:hypothetical protein
LPRHSAAAIEALSGGRPRVDGCLDGCHVSDDQGGDHTAADLLPTDQRHVGRLEHCVAGLDQGHQALGLDHAQRFHVVACHVYSR